MYKSYTAVRSIIIVVDEFRFIPVSKNIDYLPLEDCLVKLDDGYKSKFKCDLVFTCNLPNITDRKIIRININVVKN